MTAALLPVLDDLGESFSMHHRRGDGRCTLLALARRWWDGQLSCLCLLHGGNGCLVGVAKVLQSLALAILEGGEELVQVPVLLVVVEAEVERGELALCDEPVHRWPRVVGDGRGVDERERFEAAPIDDLVGEAHGSGRAGAIGRGRGPAMRGRVGRALAVPHRVGRSKAERAREGESCCQRESALSALVVSLAPTLVRGSCGILTYRKSEHEREAGGLTSYTLLSSSCLVNRRMENKERRAVSCSTKTELALRASVGPRKPLSVLAVLVCEVSREPNRGSLLFVPFADLTHGSIGQLSRRSIPADCKVAKILEGLRVRTQVELCNSNEVQSK